MGNLKSLALLALLFSLSLAVFADTSTDAAHAKDEVKPSTEATDAIEPQQRGGCRYGCCGSYAFGRCSACCSRPHTEATDAIEPQQRGGCRYGCCGSYAFGRCSACCSRPQTTEVEVDANDAVVEPQQGWGGGGCRYGCCGGWWGGRCRYCCSRSQAVEAEALEASVVDPQQGSRGGGGGGGRGGCRYGCCGGWWRGRCRYCCSSQAEANEVVESVEPQQGWGSGGLDGADTVAVVKPRPTRLWKMLSPNKRRPRRERTRRRKKLNHDLACNTNSLMFVCMLCMVNYHYYVCQNKRNIVPNPKN